jgi:hypothetical protein
MDISDIEGAKAVPKHKLRTQSVVPAAGRPNPMDYRDVTHVDFKTKREVNPLAPSYKHRDEDGKVCDIGAVFGSTS